MAQAGYKPTDILYLKPNTADKKGKYDVIGVTLGVPGTYAHNYQAFCRYGQCTVHGPLHGLYTVAKPQDYADLHERVSKQFFPGENLNVLNVFTELRKDGGGRVVVVNTPTFEGLAVLVSTPIKTLQRISADGMLYAYPLSGPSNLNRILVNMCNIRLATVKDFETYRVYYHESYEALQDTPVSAQA
ncbi:hypothetical protein [Microcystis phage Mvi-JY20]|uniref:Uncharacterized protein n=1 Tax=Microcystis phage Mvi-JY20 TaxID=3128146 RepID=A0AAX4QGB1_9CAUD